MTVCNKRNNLINNVKLVFVGEYFRNHSGTGENEIFNPRSYIQYISNTNRYLSLVFHRGNVFQEMIDVFMNINYKKNTTIYIDLLYPNGTLENAIDFGGVFRDAITEFWNTMYQTCTVGTNLKIPYVKHNFGAEKWRAMAKVLYLGWTNAKYLPIKLAMPILEQILYGKITSELIPAFLQTLCDNDKQVLSCALKNINSVDNGALMQVLSNLECRTIPNQTNLKQILEQVAHLELVQKPHFIIEQFRIELETNSTSMLSVENLYKLYESMEPSTTNILNILSHSFINKRGNEMRTYGFLEK